MNWGQSWSAPEFIDDGIFPCISIGPYQDSPWVLYYKDGMYKCAVRRPSGSWAIVNVINGPSKLEDGLSIGPSMVNALTFGEETPCDLAYGVFTNYDSVYFAAFDTTSVYVSQFLDNYDPVSAPSISITPGDYLHVTWQKKESEEGEIYYTTTEQIVEPEEIRDSQEPVWSGIVEVSKSDNPPTEPASNPTVEAYSDSVFVAWRVHPDMQNATCEIWRRSRCLANGPNEWETPVKQSNTQDNEPDYPVMSTNFVTVWQEKNGDSCNIWAKFAPEGSAQCIFQTANPSKYPQISGYWDPNPAVPSTFCCNAIWTEKIDSCYAVKFDGYRYEYNPGESKGVAEKMPPYYTVGIGDSIPSPYCMHRNGYYKYGPYAIDYSNNKLKYRLPYLNPQYYYNLQAITYRTGQNNWTQELLTDSILTGTIVTRPDIPETLAIRIPRESYRHDSKVLQDLRKTIGNWAIVADLRLYQVESLENNSKGGIQSTEVQLLRRPILFQPFPNPFGSIAIIRYFIPVKGDVSLTIYDITGRALRTFVKGKVDAGLYTIRWNGKDDMNRTRGNGIYFIKLETNDYIMTKKMIIVR